MSMRDSMKHYFMHGTIKDSKCWAGKGGDGTSTTRQIGNERHYSRLIYCITYFHSILNERTAYGTRGGFSKLSMFSVHDLAMAVHYLEVFCSLIISMITLSLQTILKGMWPETDILILLFINNR